MSFWRVASAILLVSFGTADAEDTRSRQEIIASGLGILTALTAQCGDFRIEGDRLAEFLRGENMDDPRHVPALKEHWDTGNLKMEREFRTLEFEGKSPRQIAAWACSSVLKGLTDPDNIYRVVIVRQ